MIRTASIKSTFLMFFFLLFFKTSISQIQTTEIEWQKCIGGTADEYTGTILTTSNNGLLISGSTSSNDGNVTGNHGGFSDCWIVKIDSNQIIEWQKTLGGSLDDIFSDMKFTSNKEILITASSSSLDGDVTMNNGDLDFWIIVIDTLGLIQWQKSYGGSYIDQVSSSQQTEDGGFIIAGSSASNNGDVTGNHGQMDYWIVKLDSSGNLEWQKSLGGNLLEFAEEIIQTLDGGYIVVGSAASNNGDVTGNHGSDDYWVVKLDNLGNIEWQKCYGGSGADYGNSILQMADGGYLISGQSFSNDGDVTGNHGALDIWVLKINSIGDLLWQQSYGGSGTEQCKDLIKKGNNAGYLIIGNSASSDGDVYINRGGPDCWILEIDTFGNILWQQTFGGSVSDWGTSIVQESENTFTLAGRSFSNNGSVYGNQGGSDYWMLRFKLGDTQKHIRGLLFNDVNEDCLVSPSEPGLSNLTIHQIQPSSRFLNSNSIGQFQIPIYSTGNYSFEPFVPLYLQTFIKNNCISNYNFQIDSLNIDTSGFDFGLEIEECPLLLVDVSSTIRRPCFKSTTTIAYRNDGFADQTNIEIFLELPDSMVALSASQSYSTNSSGQFVFFIDTLKPGQSGTINILDSMFCDFTLINTQACTKAWINPANNCYNNLLDPTPWDSSNIVLDGGIELDNSGDTCYRFVIANTGEVMQDSFVYYIYSGLGFIQSDSFLLGYNDSIVITICGVEYAQVLVNQHLNHPIAKSIFFSPLSTDTTIVNIYEFINIDDQLESAIECLTVVNSFDPNDKQATPSGWSSANFVETNTQLDYKIRFQNTGTAPAFNVEIIDTIDVNVLDVSKLILGGSSHPYEFELSGDSGQVVFHFKFKNINLIDSFTNEPLSHGFVSFKIGAYDNIPQGTVVNNFADIYFDFNPAIRTNTSMITLQDSVPKDLSTMVSIINSANIINISDPSLNWNVYPNPSANSFIIELSVVDNPYTLEILNILGQVMFSETKSTKLSSIDSSNWSNGIYHISIRDDNGNLIGSKKVIVNH